MATKIKKNLNEMVADNIKEKILARQYPPGAKLPNEFELAQEYDVCRYTIREAIKNLVATGLVTVARGRGTFVNEVIPATYFKPVIEKLILIEQDVTEIFDARLAIEMKTANLAALHANDADIKRMRDILCEMESALDDDAFDQFNELDLHFHRMIAAASQNRILDMILDTVHDLVRFTIEKAAISKEKHRLTLQDHGNIVEAICNRDADLAAKLMHDHLSYCKGLC